MKKVKIAVIWLMLLMIAVAGVACAKVRAKPAVNGLRIDAPETIEAELGTYRIPEYDVIDAENVVMAGYRVTLVSVKDASGNPVDYAGGGSIVINAKGIYDFEYSANTNGISNVVVKVDFADRMPPTVQLNTDDYPKLFIKGHTYSLPQYSFGAGPDLSKCGMKVYYKPTVGEKIEKTASDSFLDGLFFTVTEDSGAYEFVVHGEDAVGNVNDVTLTVPVDGPQTEVDGRIAYFNEPFGARQLKFDNAELNSGSISAKCVDDVKYSGESGSTEITIADETNYAFISVAYPVIEDLSNYDSFTFRVYNPNAYKVIFGLAWTGYKTLEPDEWTEFTFRTSYFRNHGTDAFQDRDGVPMYEDDIVGLCFVVMNEGWAQHGNVAAGTKLNISALDATRNTSVKDLRIAGETYSYVYNATSYTLDEYALVNRAGVTVDVGATVTRVSAKKPGGMTDATISADGVLQFDGGAGVYTLKYSAQYDGDGYDTTIDDLTVNIEYAGTLDVALGTPIDGTAVYTDRGYGIAQIDRDATKNVTAQIYDFVGVGKCMKLTVKESGESDVVFNTTFDSAMTDLTNYAAIRFKVHTESTLYRVYVTQGANAQYLGGDSTTRFDVGEEWVTVTCYLGKADRTKLGVHFFADYIGTPVPAGTEFFISDIQFVDAGYKNMPTDTNVNLLTESNQHGVPKTVKGRDDVDYAVSNVKVTLNGSPVTITDGKFTMTSVGVYTVKYTLHDKEYSYTVTATADVGNVDVLYAPNVNEYTVSPVITVKSVTFGGNPVTRNGNTFTLSLGGDYTVTADVFGTERTFTVSYHKPASIVENVAVYGEIGDKQATDLNNLSVAKSTDTDKGNVLTFTVSQAKHDAGVLFKNVSTVKDYDYVVFDIKASAAGYVAITKNGTSNHGSFWVDISTEWKTVSFATSAFAAGDSWYLNINDGKDDSIFGLYFFPDFNMGNMLTQGATFTVGNIRLEKGTARLQDVSYNTDRGVYTLPATVSDAHHHQNDSVWSGTTDLPITVLSVKDASGAALQIDGDTAKTVTFPTDGVYTVSYRVGKSATVYTYTVTAKNTPLENAELYYGANETYTLPTQSIGGKTVAVQSVKCGNADIAHTGGSFSLTAGTPTTANDTNTYVYTVNYTVAGDNTPRSYTLTYRKPSSVTTNRMAYFDSEYGLTHQMRVENGTATIDSKYKTDNSDRGTQSTKIVVEENGAVWLRFTNIPWNVEYNNLDIAFSTSSVLRYEVYDANGNKVKEEVAFSDSGEASRWSNVQFVAGLDGHDMSSFSIKLFNAYGENEPLAKGCEIWIVGGLGYTF